ncbi:MAG: hypothetical protein NNA18_00385 [Nitrospira sp.]|nr:hypothetical protein [Nitrospira sp.]
MPGICRCEPCRALQRYDEAMACCRTSQLIAERSQDELQGEEPAMCWPSVTGGGRWSEAPSLLEQVVELDRKYGVPRLDKNVPRLAALRARMAEDDNRHSSLGAYS